MNRSHSINVHAINVHAIDKSRRSASIRCKQSGVSLIEVLIAMVVLTFGSLAIVNLQTASLLAVNSSADHFQINELSHAIVEQLKADSARAASGEYDTAYEDAVAPVTATPDIANKINAWKAKMARSTPHGETSIQCSATECNVGLKWYENSHDGVNDQVYNLKAPI